ncbi:antibiotic biosynthesis monooxygenase [Patulibacter defluvii]|uniref:antibiotic biosynthesis monooxygenase n=1 Tax=Patulibacter defluvii TaxID=3095358 RepID=UPI002A75D645|nr:antibiotic biosynthesis monooxygenase [Patulibacter sp. DM4]
MTTVARHVQFTARPGSGDQLAELLLEAAKGLRGTPGCDQYVVSRSSSDPDVILVDERWGSAAELEQAEAGLEDDPQVAKVLALLDPERPVQRVDAQPLGGVGLFPRPQEGVTHRNLLDVEDQAPGFGVGHVGEARFATGELGLERTGLALHRINADTRQAFGHRHVEAEEVYVVLAGSGRAQVDDQTIELTARDALRVGPRMARAFEGGPEGMELLVAGARCLGDGEILQGWWGD